MIVFFRQKNKKYKLTQAKVISQAATRKRKNIRLSQKKLANSHVLTMYKTPFLQ
jgi:hypothetical protein